ncbi:23S rRNA (uracil(1939)-C(5))-methyltransferase RlmD [Alkalihalobacillus sp. MEB130]|uniref:23S rRNA (uracil(1939)-C(5))-methyltransferase RlmD n=1 Tax=Alkalihalobacillus sp. MEB130 TaxID=2976704 RepID=UPI0028E03336|nr:23S rRNA (uracil(1939)-C(5))-methyltransferase RlmD [Alkalihalobacillus sp. MEB130]MDT8860959.1 23S rRNA (uracil(1939)-C(5))-methyltransferase RlmD [Alkalihalobacillus sp. MEB130]
MNQKPAQKSINMKIGQKFPLTIKRLGINGEGVGYFKKQVVFVPGALPNEEIVAEVTKINPRFSEAKVVKIRKPSKERIEPPCPIFDQCGGCQLQHMNYAATLREKRDIVKQAFERHTKLNLEKLMIHDTIGMDDPWDYRNKSQLQVGKRGDEVIAGLYAMNSHTLIDLTQCKVQHKATNKVTHIVKQILADLNVSIYNERKHKGAIRTIVTRVGFETGQVQVVLVTKEEELPRKESIVAEIKKRLPEVTSIIQNINNQKTSIIFGEKTVHLAGEEVIEEKLGDLSFTLSARAFFQLNPEQTVKLYNVVKQAAKLTGKEKVVDAYCGVGTIGLWLAKDTAEVRGMDVIEASIVDARNNAKNHDYHHVSYEVGKAETLLPRWQKEGWKPDVVVVDPPRTGCDEKLLQTIIEVKPKRMVYVSCNPSTLAKDVDRLCKKGYKVKSIQPVDMFPWTAQVESVTELVREK